MAGNYPDVPAPRMPYDVDGTQVFNIDPTNVPVAVDSTHTIALNDEDSTSTTTFSTSTGGTGSYYLAFLFPEARDLVGYYINGGPFSGGMSASAIETSSNTTNGVDGTWTQATATFTNSTAPGLETDSRNNIVGLSVTNIKAVRIKAAAVNTPSSYAFKVVHLYGDYHTGANPDRVELWDAAGSARLTGPAFDEGDCPRSSSADKTFKVKNLSATLTAHSVALSVEALTDTSPSVPGQYTLSTNGSTFTSSINIGDLAPGALSGTLYLRRVTPSNAILSAWVARVKAVPSSMS